jgi:hypothetical protein
MYYRILLAAISLQSLLPCLSQTIATLEVNLLKPANGLSIPASIDVDKISFLPDSVLSLV